jgi:hypothetical protein
MTSILKHSNPILLWLALLAFAGAAQGQNYDPSAKRYPGTCEEHSAILDMLRNKLMQGDDKEGVIIAVARLGDGERMRNLNRRRLYNLRVHFTDYGFPAQKLIAAEGKRVKGFGRVELYVGGKLIDVLLVARNGDLCVDCCDIDERLYPYRGKKRQGLR